MVLKMFYFIFLKNILWRKEIKRKKLKNIFLNLGLLTIYLVFEFVKQNIINYYISICELFKINERGVFFFYCKYQVINFYIRVSQNFIFGNWIEKLMFIFD